MLNNRTHQYIISLRKGDLILKFVAFLFLFLFFITGCSQILNPSSKAGVFHVLGNGMNPTILDGNVLVIDLDAYQDQLPERGDIIIFTHPNNSDITFAKRVIGLPDESIEIVNQSISIDGQLLEETYIKEPLRYSGNWMTGEREYFVLSDNRNNGSDSHNWGELPFENIIGKAIDICIDDSLTSCQRIQNDD